METIRFFPKLTTHARGLKTFLTVGLFMFTVGCSSSGEEFKYLDDGGESGSSTVGNSAIAFTPSSLDFGPAALSVGTVNKLISLENTSAKNVFINSFEGDNTSFIILTNNCPTGTSAFGPGQSCQMTVQFAPKSAGVLSTTMLVKYGEVTGDDSFNSLMGLSGTGVGSLNFGGIDSVDNIAHNAARLNWTAESAAVSYMIFQVVGGSSLNYIDTVVNTGGTVTNYSLTSLMPNTTYDFRVRAVDSLGNQDGNTNDANITTAVNQAPVVTSLVPAPFYSGEVLPNLDANDSNTASDVDLDGDAISYGCRYDNSVDGIVGVGLGDCASLVNEGGGSPTFGVGTGVFSGWSPQHAQVGTAFEFEVTGTDIYGASSSTVFSNTVIAGQPVMPSVTGVLPAGPVNNNAPVVSGTSEPNMTVNIFSDSGCVTQIGTGTADGVGDWSVTATVADDTTTQVYAQAQNIIGNNSTCSSTSTSFTEDSTAPSIFVLGTTPSISSSVNSPTIDGLTEANASVEIFSDAGCTTSVTTGSANGGGAYNLSVAIAYNTPTTYYAKATDAAGNTSTCSATNVSYTAYEIATGIGHFTSSQTNASSPIVNNNPADLLSWNSSQYDFNYFTHSSSTNAHQITVKTSGHYLFSLTLPLTMTAGTYRPTVQSEILVNGSVLPGSRGESSYIRNDSSHYESSNNIAYLGVNLTAGDIVTIAVKGTSGHDGSEVVQLTNIATLYAEFINGATRNVFAGTATQTTDDPNLNQATPYALEWSETLNTNGFTHGGGSSENIGLDNGGDYLVFVNVPLANAVSADRPNVAATVRVNTVTVTGGEAKQGYMRADSGHEAASVHWAGIVTGTAPGDNLQVYTQQTSTATTVTVPAGAPASIMVEEVSTGTNMFSARATQLTGGNNWNPSSAEAVRWANLNNAIIDPSVFGHDTVTNNHQITLKQKGDYLIIFNASFSSTVQRAAPKITVQLDTVNVTGAEAKTGYIRGTANHYDSSNSLVYLLRDVSANQVLTISSQEAGETGNVDDDREAIITLIKK